VYNTGGSGSDDGNRFGLNLPFVVHDVKFLFPRQFSGILDLEHANCRRFKVTTADIRGWRIRHPWMAFHHCGGGGGRSLDYQLAGLMFSAAKATTYLAYFM